MKTSMARWIGVAALAFAAATAPAAAGNLTIKGSDTMVILGQRWAEEYMKAHPGAQVQVTGGGSGTGISALINGTTDICQSSRKMKDSEMEKLRERYATTGVEIPVAKDGLSVYVHESSPVSELSLGQLKGIFSGKITNWNEVGGPDARIIVYSRENSSGTYVFFKDVVLGGGDFTPRALTLPGTAAVVNGVSREKYGIGYGGAAYSKRIRVLKLKRNDGAPAVAPDAATVKDGSYALARDLYFYLRNRPSGDVGAFVTWVLSGDGQAIVNKVGYFPVR